VDRIINIELFGQTYSFKADAEADQIERIARYVISEVEKASKSGEMPSKLDSVILAALNIASSYFEAKQDHEGMVEDINRRSKAMVEMIERKLLTENY
jgi:cell division protein ZapA (FtsZ GTPase activity inhibitor)